MQGGMVRAASARGGSPSDLVLTWGILACGDGAKVNEYAQPCRSQGP